MCKLLDYGKKANKNIIDAGTLDTQKLNSKGPNREQLHLKCGKPVNTAADRKNYPYYLKCKEKGLQTEF